MVSQLVEDWKECRVSPMFGEVFNGGWKRGKKMGDFLVGGDCSLRAMNWQVSDTEHHFQFHR